MIFRDDGEHKHCEVLRSVAYSGYRRDPTLRGDVYMSDQKIPLHADKRHLKFAREYNLYPVEWLELSA